MDPSHWIKCVALVSVLLCLIAPTVVAEEDAAIPTTEIAELQTQLGKANEATSSARKKLAIRRVIRACEGLLEKHSTASNRYEVLSVLFRSQQMQLGVDDSAMNRRALLDTCQQLATASNEYAAIRLDADLLLSQSTLAKQGADPKARANALKPLVDRYQDTEVEAKVIRIAMLMAIEFGDAGLIQHLRATIAERMPGNLEMINFQRDQLAGQVFGAPFVGRFEGSDGKAYRLPLDGMGKTTGLYFWSKEGDGLEQLKLLADGWNQVKANPELNAGIRYQFLSFNLDGLPDAGESLLREAGLDWPALHLPDGRENPVYKTYVRNDPKLLTATPSGYAAMVMSGATRVRPDRGWEKSFQSRLARSWSRQRYAMQLQSLLAGDFLVSDPSGGFNPVAPPEWKAVLTADSQQAKKLVRSTNSVPVEKLNSIQACFTKPPMRYRLTQEQARANYEKAEALCRQAIQQHPDADDLWIVRNRRIVALMGLWKTDGKREHYDAALEEAKLAIDKGYPDGCDVIARFCIARQDLRDAKSELPGVIEQFVQADGDEPKSASVFAAASLLSLEIGERKLHKRYRRASLDKHADHPMLWDATAFLMDRYQRYWLYHPPFTAGWTYGRRMGHFLAIGTAEDAERSIQLELKTVDGESVRFSEDTEGKWSIIEFRPDAETNPHLHRYGTFIKERPFKDVQLIAAVLSDDAAAARDALAKRLEEQQKRRQGPDPFQTLLVPGGINHPIAQQLGILDEDTRPNIAVVRPDGSIAAFLSGLTMSSQHGNAIQNVLEWHDEKAVVDALARGDLDEAKRLAFAYAPVEQVAPPDAPRHWKPKKLTVPHLRARAKVYVAMEDWEAAYTDAQAVYLEVNKKAGWLSMRTADLDEAEALRELIQSKLNQASSAK
jgi:tetratricopeptide (TPR) repeat protein